MPSAYTQNFYHPVFSTKHRANLITSDLESLALLRRHGIEFEENDVFQ